jgi:uncharacterized protein
VKPLRARLEEARKRLQLPWEILERDYLLSWTLAAIEKVPPLSETLVFKGGTALKKCYFGDYRFSEDLDFWTQGTPPTGGALEQAMHQLWEATSSLLNEFAPVSIDCERYIEKELHPSGQEAFSIRAQLPWHRQPQTRILVEVTFYKRVLRPIGRRKILNEYGEPMDSDAEKLRAILQHIEKLESRGWSRSRARDYYDLWRILNRYKTTMQPSDFGDLLRQKCMTRNVTFASAEDFFQKRMMDYVEKTWNQWLGPLVPGLPSFQQVVIDQLHPEIVDIVRGKPNNTRTH